MTGSEKRGKVNRAAAELREIECFVLDMDGTINLGENLIPGAKEYIEYMQKNGISFYFFTNNSSKAPEDYVKKLERLGFSGMTRGNIMTSGDVMIHYLRTHGGQRIYLAGTPELEAQFQEAGFTLLPHDTQTADFAVLGFV